MGLMKRFSDIFRAKTSKMLDKAEDPRETLDYSYERQLEMLQKVRRGLADVATSRKRIEMQITQLQGSQAKLEEQARQAMTAGREDLAREALSRKAGLGTQLESLNAQEQQLNGEEQKLTTALQRLQAKVEAFRTKKETLKATYTAAEASTKIGEAVSGLSEEMGDVGMAVQRAEDKTAQMQARAGAVDALLASGALDDVTAEPNADISAELAKLTANSSVDAELAKLKAELGPGTQRRAAQGRELMIVRILEEGQLELPADAIDELNTLDDDLIAAVEAGDEAGFAQALVRPAGPGAGSGHARPARPPRPVGDLPALRRRHHRRGAGLPDRRRGGRRLPARLSRPAQRWLRSISSFGCRSRYDWRAR